MTKLARIFLFLIAATPLSAFSHDYFFSYAEVEYNDFTQRLEATLDITAHDLEEAFLKNGDSVRFEQVFTTADVELFEDYINKNFHFGSASQKSNFSYIGHELELTGIAHIYLQSDPIELPDELTVRYSVLMDNFINQQNKLTFIHRGQKQTIAFLQHEKEQQISTNQTHE